MADIPVQCTRCRNQHMESELVGKPRKGFSGSTELCCPRCGCKSFYDLSPQVAWCWASGLIEVGDTMPDVGPDGGGAIQIASGPKAFLKGQLDVLARHGKGESRGKLLVPGVPEAESEQAKGDALAAFLAWCWKRKSRSGVVFNQERTENAAALN